MPVEIELIKIDVGTFKVNNKIVTFINGKLSEDSKKDLTDFELACLRIHIKDIYEL